MSIYYVPDDILVVEERQERRETRALFQWERQILWKDMIFDNHQCCEESKMGCGMTE